MLKKAKAAMADEAGTAGKGGSNKDMSQSVLDSSRHIWLAGLGAFSRAQAEGMKVFETLVRQGEALESKTRRAAVDTAAAARGAAHGQGEGSEGRRGRHVGQAGAGVRGNASRARCRSSACIRRTTSSA